MLPNPRAVATASLRKLKVKTAGFVVIPNLRERSGRYRSRFR